MVVMCHSPGKDIIVSKTFVDERLDLDIWKHEWW